MKINLIFFISNFSFGGAGNSISKLCYGLSKKKYKITVICLGKCAYKKNLKKNKINFFELKKTKLLFAIIAIYKTIKKNIKYKNKNILISNIHYNNIILSFIARKIKNLKLILVERTPLEELDIIFSIKDFFKKQIIKILIRISYKNADIIVSNSNGIKKSLLKYVKKPIITIYPPAIKNINHVKKTNKIVIKNILCLSRLSEEKNIETAIIAMKYLKKFKIKLNIYGDGKEKNKLKNLIKYLNLKNSVFLKKYSNNTFSIFKKHQVLVSTSLFEGCGNSIIESINNNLIILSSNCPGGNSEILLNGKGGFFFKTSDPIDLSHKLKNIVKTPNKSHNKTIVAKKFLKRFLISNNLSAYKQIFDKI